MWFCLFRKFCYLPVCAFARRWASCHFNLSSCLTFIIYGLCLTEKATQRTKNSNDYIRRWRLNGNIFTQSIDFWNCWIYRVLSDKNWKKLWWMQKCLSSKESSKKVIILTKWIEKLWCYSYIVNILYKLETSKIKHHSRMT